MAESTLTDDLIGWWSMGDCPTELQSDELNRTVLIGENLTQITGLVGKAVEFASDGTSRLYAASNSLLQLAHRPFTFAVWVKFNSISTSQVLLSKTDSNPISAQFRLEYDSFSNAITFRVGNVSFPNQVVAFNSTSPPLNQWHLIIGWLDADEGKLHIRMDNSNYENISTHAMVGGMDVNDNTFSIGSNPGGTDPLIGLIDNVALWGRVLTRTEQQLLWNRRQGANYCALLDADCKTIDCCDPALYEYKSSTSSDADGGMRLRLPPDLIPIEPVPPPTTPPASFNPCAAVAPIQFTDVAETGNTLPWDSTWGGIAFCDSLDMLIADSTDNSGIALINFNVTPPVVDHVLPLNTPFLTRGICYHPLSDVIIVFVRNGTAPGYTYRLSFLDPTTGFQSDLDLGVAGGNNEYEATFCFITFKTIGILVRSLTTGVPHMITVVDVDARTVVSSALFQSGGVFPFYDFTGLCYSCVLNELVSVGTKNTGTGILYYLTRFNVSTLAITAEFLLPTPSDVYRTPVYITSTGHVFVWSVDGYFDVNPANGALVQFATMLVGNVEPIYHSRINRYIGFDGGTLNAVFFNPQTYAKIEVPVVTALGNSWAWAAARADGRCFLHDGAIAPFLIHPFDIS